MKIKLISADRPEDESSFTFIQGEPVFMECDSCRAKPGSPSLCTGCLHNRDVIAQLTNNNVTAFEDGVTERRALQAEEMNERDY